MTRVTKKPKEFRNSGVSISDPVSWARGEIEGNITLAQKNRYGHKYEAAMSYYGKALELLPPADLSVVKRSEINREMIECLCDQGEYSRALEQLEKVRKLLTPEVSAVSLELGRLHNLAAHIHSQLGSYEMAGRECRKALELFEAHGEEADTSRAYKYLGQIQLLTGDVSSAFNSFVQSLASFQRIGNETEMASVMNRMAQVYFVSSDWERCINLLEEARELAEKNEMFRLVGAITANLGTIHFVLGNWDLARKYNESSLNIFQMLSDSLSITRRYICLGNLHQVKREWKDAQRLYETAKALAEEKEYKRELALSLEFLGELDFDMENIAQAESKYRRALRIAREIAPGGDLINEIYRRFAELRVYQGEGRKALSLCQKSWEVSLRLGDRFEEGVVLRAFGMAYNLLGDHERARDYFSQGIDSLRSIGEKYERAKTLLAAGKFISQVFTDYGSRMEALRYLSQARDLVKELGLDYLLGIMELELEKVRQISLT
ncbi:MAG: tetratricopeptide repeat protein [Candidatus Glassbacteria bacterium]